MVILWTVVLILGLVPTCLLARVNNWDDAIANVHESVPATEARSFRTERELMDVVKFMKKLYHNVDSGRLPLPKDANTVRSFWPLKGNYRNGYLVYNVSMRQTEKLVTAMLHIRSHGDPSGPYRISIDAVPIPGSVPPGINVQLKNANRLDIKKVVVSALKTNSLVTIRPQQLVNGSWVGLELRSPPVIVTFISDSISPRLKPFLLRDPVMREALGTNIRRKRESNSIHSTFAFEDLPGDPDQKIDKGVLKAAISKRQRYLRKKLNRRKEKKHKKNRKSSKRRKQKKRKKNGLIPYPKDYSNKSKDHGESKKRKKIIPQMFISASLNRISNEVSSSPMKELPSSGICELKKVFVDFKDLGWGDFVIAPLGFSPNYCSGGCPNPLSRSDAGSNHALIRSLMRNIGQWPGVPMASCVADKVTSLTLLVQTQDGRIELKNYPGMQADSCSCQ